MVVQDEKTHKITEIPAQQSKNPSTNQSQDTNQLRQLNKPNHEQQPHHISTQREKSSSSYNLPHTNSQGKSSSEKIFQKNISQKHYFPMSGRLNTNKEIHIKSTYQLPSKIDNPKKYYHLQNISYSNYKYEKPELGNSEFGFLSKLPLDGINKAIIPKQLQTKNISIEDTIAKYQESQNMMSQDKFTQAIVDRKEAIIKKQNQNYMMLQKDSIIQQRLKQLNQQIQQGTIRNQQQQYNQEYGNKFWISPLKQYQIKQKEVPKSFRIYESSLQSLDEALREQLKIQKEQKVKFLVKSHQTQLFIKKVNQPKLSFVAKGNAKKEQMK